MQMQYRKKQNHKRNIRIMWAIETTHSCYIRK